MKTARTYQGFSKIERKIKFSKKYKEKRYKKIYGEILKIVREMEGKNKERQTV